MGEQAAKNEKTPPRQRLLAAANELFYNEGIRAVGIDRVIERAGVAKGSLYYNFSGGKDDLIKEYLLGRNATWAARVDQEVAKHEEPRHKILGVFDALGTVFSEPDYRGGCAFMNAMAGAPENGPEIQAAANFRTWLHTLFEGIVADLDVQNPSELTDRLIILYDGAVTAALMDHTPKAATTAKTLAAMVLGLHPSETRADHVTAQPPAVGGPVLAGRPLPRLCGDSGSSRARRGLICWQSSELGSAQYDAFLPPLPRLSRGCRGE